MIVTDDITAAEKGRIEYVYDAAGNKLKKIVTEVGQPARTTQLYLEDYLLNINNPITILPSCQNFDDLIGLKIVAIYESKEEAKLFFDNSSVLIVNLRDEVYWDPEAMALYGPYNFSIVWN